MTLYTHSFAIYSFSTGKRNIQFNNNAPPDWTFCSLTDGSNAMYGIRS